MNNLSDDQCRQELRISLSKVKYLDLSGNYYLTKNQFGNLECCFPNVESLDVTATGGIDLESMVLESIIDFVARRADKLKCLKVLHMNPYFLDILSAMPGLCIDELHCSNGNISGPSFHEFVRRQTNLRTLKIDFLGVVELEIDVFENLRHLRHFSFTHRLGLKHIIKDLKFLENLESLRYLSKAYEHSELIAGIKAAPFHESLSSLTLEMDETALQDIIDHLPNLTS